MDLAPSPGNSPRAPFAWGNLTPPHQEATFPIAKWEELGDDQKRVAESIYGDLEDRAGVQRNTPHSVDTTSEIDSPELLSKMATLAKTIPYLNDTKKGRYYLLIENIKSFSADFISSKKRLESWQGLVNEKRTAFRESRPQGQAPEQKEEEEKYQELCQNYPKFVIKLHNLTKMTQALEENEEITSLDKISIDISPASFKLITDVYFINLKYLNDVISDFAKQKKDLKEKITCLSDQRKEIDSIYKKFDKSFKRLGYYQENGRNLYSITSFAYNQLWDSSTPEAVSPTGSQPVKSICSPDKLQNEKKLVLNSFAQKITDAKENIFYLPINEIKAPSGLIPLPLLAISAWVPCFPQKRVDLDTSLTDKISTLNETRKKAITELQNLQIKIKAAASIQSEPSLNDDNIEKINNNLEKIRKSFVNVTSEIQKRIDLEKERLDLEKKNPKLKQGIKPTIPLAELQQISIFLGIPEDTLKDNVTRFQRTTELFINFLEKLILNKNNLDNEVWQTNRELDRLNQREFSEFLKEKWGVQNTQSLPKEIDYLLLNSRIKSLLKELKANAEGCFKEWKEQIADFTHPEKIKELFSTHFEGARKTLEEVNKSYSTFCIGKYKELLTEKDDLLSEIKSRVAEREFIETSEGSLLLVSNCNDDMPPQSLTTHIKRYHERINKLKKKQDKLAHAETSIKKAEESFKSEYAKLNYMLLNNTPRLPVLGSVTEECYPNPMLCKEKSIRLNLFSKCDADYKKQFIELLPTRHKQELLTNLQKEYKKTLLDPSHPEFKTQLNALLCAENIFSEVWIKDFISKAYIPLKNHQKLLDDANLCLETQPLISEIITINKKISPILELWKEFWDNANQLRISGNGANKRICDRQAQLIPLIEENSKGIKKELRKYVEENSMEITRALKDYIEAEEKDLPLNSLFIDYQVHKQNAICFQQAITTLYIYKIAKAYSELKNKLTKRIETAAKKNGVSPASIKIISLTHDDINAEALKLRIDEYLKTETFEKLLTKLEESYRLFKESTEQIIYPFDYFSYQQKYGYGNDFTTSATFMGMHLTGLHNYMDRGEVTKPFKIPGPAQIEYGFIFENDEIPTDGQFSTGCNNFTDAEQEVLTSYSDEAFEALGAEHPNSQEGLDTILVPFKKCCPEGQQCENCSSDWW